jgi:hypothetical protein
MPRVEDWKMTCEISRVDIYMLALTMYGMLTGRKPKASQML